MSFYFQDKTWVELKECIDEGGLVLLPLGMVEEHGQHMAVGADAMIAEDTSRAIASYWAEHVKDPPLLVTPTFWSGYSMEIIKAWPGTLSLRADVLLAALTDIVGSLAKMGFYRIVVSNNHGNHDGVIRQLVRDVADRHNVWTAAIQPASFAAKRFSEVRKTQPGGAIHAGEYETSLMLHYGRPVDMSKATNVDHMRYSSTYCPADGFSGSKPVVWSTWGLQPSQTGAYGDATPASKETGAELEKAIVANTVEFLREFCRVTTR